MLRIQLLGSFSLCDPRGKPIKLPTRKAEALLAYLIMERDRPQARERLAGLLWGESPEDKARLSLRAALHALNQALEPEPDQKGKYILLARTNVQFNTQAPCWIDLVQFERLLEQADALKGPEQARALEEATALYRGELLEGIYDEWCLDARDRLKDLYLKALQELVVYHAERKEFDQAIPFAKELLAKNPLQEEVHRQLIYLYFAKGERNAALGQYRECQRVLKEELDVEPLPETQALYREIEARASLSVPEAKRVQAAIARDLLRRYPQLGAPFVGRTNELAQLVASWEAARAGQGRTVCIQGEAGVGKTRLVQELAQYVQQADGRTLAGRCYELQARMPFHPLIEALRLGLGENVLAELGQVSPLWLAEVAKLVPELSEQLPGVRRSSSLLTPEQERQRLFEGLTQTFLALARRRPLLLVLDDLQWADEPSLQFMHYLARRIAKEPLLLVSTYRTGEVAEDHPLMEVLQQLQRDDLVKAMELQALSPEEVEALVAGALTLEPGKLDEATGALVERIHRDSQGNPFFAVELLKSFIESGALYLDEARNWQIAQEKLVVEVVPEVVRAVVQMRLRRASHRSRELLSLAATAGRAFEAQLLSRASGWREEEVLTSLEELLKRGFFAEERALYNFNHDLIRRVIYAGLSVERRRGLHLQVAKTLEAVYAQRPEGNGIVGEIAKHFYEAGQWKRALDYALLAGKRAWASYAKREAASFFQMALELAEKLENEQALMHAYRGLGEIHCFTDKPDEGLQYSLKALELCHDPSERTDIYCTVAHVYHRKRDLEKGLSYCEKALEELGPHRESPGAVKAYYHASTFLNWLRQYEKAIQYCTCALEILEKHADENAMALILAELGHAYSEQGNYEAATEQLSRSASLAEKAGDPYSIGLAFFVLARAYYQGGYVGQAIEAWSRSLQAIESLRGRDEEAAAIYNHLIYAYLKKKELDQALYCAHQQLESSQKAGNSASISVSFAMLGCLNEAIGSENEARKFFTQVLELAPEHGGMYYNVINTYLHLGNVEKALEWLERGLPYLRERHVEALKSGPAEAPSWQLLRQDSRFQTLISRRV